MNSTAETLLDLPNEVITEVYQNLDVFGFLSARQVGLPGILRAKILKADCT